MENEMVTKSIEELNRRITLGELEERLRAIDCTILSEIPAVSGVHYSIKVVSKKDPTKVLSHTWSSGNGLEMAIIDALISAEEKSK